MANSLLVCHSFTCSPLACVHVHFLWCAGVSSHQRMQPRTSLISSRGFSSNCRPPRKKLSKLQTSPRALAGTAVKVGAVLCVYILTARLRLNLFKSINCPETPPWSLERAVQRTSLVCSVEWCVCDAPVASQMGFVCSRQSSVLFLHLSTGAGQWLSSS